METINTKIPGCYIYQCDRHMDERGFFQELYKETDGDCPKDFIKWHQANWSHSKKGVLRGIHKATFDKLVTCVSGRIFDVVIDLREGSETFLTWVGTWLEENDSMQLHVPPGCGHAFYAEKDSDVVYLRSNTYDTSPPEENYHYQDPEFKIEWPVGVDFILSEKDANAPHWE